MTYRPKRSMRPKKKAADKKETIIKVRVTDAQKVAMDKAADRDGMDLSAFARHLMIERARELGIEV